MSILCKYTTPLYRLESLENRFFDQYHLPPQITSNFDDNDATHNLPPKGMVSIFFNIIYRFEYCPRMIRKGENRGLKQNIMNRRRVLREGAMAIGGQQMDR